MNREPVRLATDDIIKTRRNPIKLSMRWPVDENTSERLRRVIRLDAASPVPWWRRVIRWLRRIR